MCRVVVDGIRIGDSGLPGCVYHKKRVELYLESSCTKSVMTSSLFYSVSFISFY